MRTQYSFEGRAEQVMDYVASVSENYHLREDEKIRFPSTVDKHFTSLYQPLGNSDLSSTKAPAWKMRFYNNKMLNWETQYTGSRRTQDIPQIDAAITYKTRINAEDEPDIPDTETPGTYYPQPDGADDTLKSAPFPDGTFVTVEPDYILLDLQELNTLFETENFDIEVYEVKTATLANGNTRDELIPLKYQAAKKEVVDNLLVDVEDQERVSDPSFSDYFFDVLVDEEIDEVIMCKSLSNLKAKGIYIENQFDCPDLTNTTQEGNIYPAMGTDVEKCSTEGGS